MGLVGASFTMSLDGFIAGLDGAVGPLFNWYNAGDIVYRYPGNGMTVRVSAASAAVIREMVEATGALVVGRRHFDEANGWGGCHPIGRPVFVVSHRPAPSWLGADAPFTFVADGVAVAVAKARDVAGEQNVAVGGADVVQQALRAGLIDEIGMELVPILLGEGRSFFGELGIGPIMLEQIRNTEGTGVTHLRFKVVK